MHKKPGYLGYMSTVYRYIDIKVVLLPSHKGFKVSHYKDPHLTNQEYNGISQVLFSPSAPVNVFPKHKSSSPARFSWSHL